ncbi:MAG: SulP family inorganic anion transporter [Motilibacteraceae bacterium]
MGGTVGRATVSRWGTALAALAPGIGALRGYRRPWLRGDVVAGLTVAAYLVPQVMAYSEIAGLPAVTGLWAICATLLVYAVVGTSRQLSVGPESTTALMTAAAVGPLAAGDPARYAVLATTLAAVVAGLCLVGWAARLGFLADLLSKPVLVGYMAGVAVVMVVGQLGKITGVTVSGDSFLSDVQSWLRGLGSADPATLALAGAVLVALFLGSWRFPRAPVPLVVMLAAAAVVSGLGLDVAVVGRIPAGLPPLSLPSLPLGDLRLLLLPAVGIAIVGYTDNVLTARSFATRRRCEIDANQEMFALAAANAGSSLVSGFPVSSSASRTVIGDAVGSRSQLHNLVALALVLASLLALGRVLSAFPSAALGAVVVYAATRLVDVAEFRRFAAFRRSELVLALATTVMVLLAGVLYGVLAAVGLSILDLLRRVARPHQAVLGFAPGLAGMHDVDDNPGTRRLPGLVVYRYDSPLFFANAEDFRRRALAAVDDAAQPVEWFLLNAEGNVEVDMTGVDALDAVREELGRRGVVMALARVKRELLEQLTAAGFLERLGPGHVFPTLPVAVQAYLEDYRRRHGQSPDGVDVVQPPPPAPLPPLPPAPRRRPEGLRGPREG